MNITEFIERLHEIRREAALDREDAISRRRAIEWAERANIRHDHQQRRQRTTPLRPASVDRCPPEGS